MIQACIMRCVDFSKWLDRNKLLLDNNGSCYDFCSGISSHLSGESRDCVKNPSKLIVIWRVPPSDSIGKVPDDIARKTHMVKAWPDDDRLLASCYGFKCDIDRQSDLQDELRYWCLENDHIVTLVDIASIFGITDIIPSEWTEGIWGA